MAHSVYLEQLIHNSKLCRKASPSSGAMLPICVNATSACIVIYLLKFISFLEGRCCIITIEDERQIYKKGS
jgi:hypothetical protein